MLGLIFFLLVIDLWIEEKKISRLLHLDFSTAWYFATYSEQVMGYKKYSTTSA